MTDNHIIVIVCILLLAGCDDYTQRQLENEKFVQTVIAEPPQPVEPVPDLKPKASRPQLLVRRDLFMPIEQRQLKIRSSDVCYTPIERGYTHVYRNRSVDDLVFLRFRTNSRSFSVTIWDGEELRVLYKNALLGKGQWQLSAVNKQGVTLSQLDQCSQVKSTRTGKFVSIQENTND